MVYSIRLSMFVNNDVIAAHAQSTGGQKNKCVIAASAENIDLSALYESIANRC